MSHVLVARMRLDTLEYLADVRHGFSEWVLDAAQATQFDSLREATRQAMRLPSKLRAFAFPMTQPELSLAA
jgi:hypothetical protein